MITTILISYRDGDGQLHEETAEVSSLDAAMLSIAPFLAWEMARLLTEVPIQGDDLIATLIDLARDNREADFRWLAASAGVAAAELEALWSGLRTRVR